MNDGPYRVSKQPIEAWERDYRALLVTPQGDVVSVQSLTAEDDEEALALAKSLVNGHAIDLWDGLRFIEHFDAIHTAS